MPDDARQDKLRLGGMALRNGLLVHGPTHWAAAVPGAGRHDRRRLRPQAAPAGRASSACRARAASCASARRWSSSRWSSARCPRRGCPSRSGRVLGAAAVALGRRRRPARRCPRRPGRRGRRGRALARAVARRAARRRRSPPTTASSTRRSPPTRPATTTRATRPRSTTAAARTSWSPLLAANLAGITRAARGSLERPSKLADAAVSARLGRRRRRGVRLVRAPRRQRGRARPASARPRAPAGARHPRADRRPARRRPRGAGRDPARRGRRLTQGTVHPASPARHLARAGRYCAGWPPSPTPSRSSCRPSTA